MDKEKKERDVSETVLTWIGIVSGMLLAAEIAFFVLLQNNLIDPSKW